MKSYTNNHQTEIYYISLFVKINLFVYQHCIHQEQLFVTIPIMVPSKTVVSNAQMVLFPRL